MKDVNGIEEEILNYIEVNPTGVNIQDIHEATGRARNTISKYLTALELKEKVQVKTLGRNKIYLSANRNFIPKRIVQSFMKGVLSSLKRRFPDMGSLIKEMGKEISGSLYQSLPKSLMKELESLRNEGNRTRILESFEDIYPNFDLFQDSYTINAVEIDEQDHKAVYRFKNSEFIGETEDFSYYFHAMCGVLEGFARDQLDTMITCNVENVQIERNEKDSYVDISVQFN